MSDTRTIEVFTFAELGTAAQERVRGMVAGWGYDGSDEALESIKALAAHFDYTLSDYNIDWGKETYSSWSFTPKHDDVPEDATAEQVAALGPGDGACVLTGVYTDELLIDGVRGAWTDHGERQIAKLLNTAMGTLLDGTAQELAYQTTDEALTERFEDALFTAEGRVFHDAERAR